jgi:hypothetical protein
MNGDILAVVGTFGGTIIGATVGYMLQQRGAERQHRWELDNEKRRRVQALEDEERHSKRALEDERRRMKRELVEKRIEPLSEYISLVAKRVDLADRRNQGLSVYHDEVAERRDVQRIQDLQEAAFHSVKLINSNELQLNYNRLRGVYWSLTEEGCLEEDDARTAWEAAVAIEKHLDQLVLDACSPVL